MRFTNLTLLNYFHLHKTGGVTTKSQLMMVMDHKENEAKRTKRGDPLTHIQTCYKAVSPSADVITREANWRCDFGEIKHMSKERLHGVDLLMGHQYWDKGCDYYFGSSRDVKYFSIFRHPLHRKLSFFYHFFVRNAGRKEDSVTREEVVRFMLAEGLPNDPRVRDLGPNYYASRFVSDGLSGFLKNQFTVDAGQADAFIADIRKKIDERYVFIGLQLQNEASRCMLQKTVQVLAHAHGIDDLVGTSVFTDNENRLNTGGYTWTAGKLWASMSAEQRQKFRQVERVDLAVYEAAVERFKDDVKVFDCADKVVASAWEDDTFT